VYQLALCVQECVQLCVTVCVPCRRSMGSRQVVWLFFWTLRWVGSDGNGDSDGDEGIVVLTSRFSVSSRIWELNFLTYPPHTSPATLESQKGSDALITELCTAAVVKVSRQECDILPPAAPPVSCTYYVRIA
jgi:hypothetical protein